MAYKVGTVYKIFSEQGDKFYLGSTIQPVKQRFQGHKTKYLLYKAGKKVSACSSFELFDLYGVDKCKWVRLKVIEVADSTHLKAYEQLYMNRLQCNNMINKRLALDLMNKKCEHQHPKWRCKDCGAGYCEHNRQKNQCKDCKTGICEHQRRKSMCKFCNPYTCAVCNITIAKAIKSQHEKTAKHIRNSN